MDTELRVLCAPCAMSQRVVSIRTLRVRLSCESYQRGGVAEMLDVQCYGTRVSGWRFDSLTGSCHISDDAEMYDS